MNIEDTSDDDRETLVPRSTRYEVAFAMAIGPSDAHRLMGMTRNASASGVLVACPDSFEVGDRVGLMFKLGDDGRYENVNGRVVRHDIDAASETWRHLLAVEFERPMTTLEKRLAEMARQQREG